MDETTPKQVKQPESSEVKKKQAALLSQMAEIGFEFGIMIALPLIVFIYFGKKLDAVHHTKYWTITGILLALAFSTFAIYRKIKQIKDLMDKK